MEGPDPIIATYTYTGAVFNLIAYPIYMLLGLTFLFKLKKYKIDKKAKITIYFYNFKLFLIFLNSILAAIDFFTDKGTNGLSSLDIASYTIQLINVNLINMCYFYLIYEIRSVRLLVESKSISLFRKS
jgi:hypothetical protein